MAQETGKEKSAHDVQEAVTAQDVQQEQNDTAGPEATEEETIPSSIDAVSQLIDAAMDRTLKRASTTAKEAQKTPGGILALISYFNVLTNFMRDPGEAILALDTPGVEELYIKYAETQYMSYVKQVAKDTGDSPLQIMDREKRTPEQDRALTEAAGRAQLERLDKFFNTSYMQAFKVLSDEEIKTETITDPDEIREIKNAVVLYFFARNWPKLRPDSNKKLTAEQKHELKSTLIRFDKFIANRPAASMGSHFIAFIKEDCENPEEIQRNIPRITGAPPDSILWPLDKLNKQVWYNLDPQKAVNDHYYFAVAKENRKRGIKKTDAFIEYGIHWAAVEKAERNGEIEITEQLTPFDKRVYVAVYALYKSHGCTMSSGMIYYAMGYNSAHPNSKIIEKINKSLDKMRSALVFINNKSEAGMYKNINPFFMDDVPLLSFRRRDAYINNSYCGSAIYLLIDSETKKPPFPLMDFAIERDQITTIPRILLESPLSATESNMTLEDYLRDEIAWMKNNSNVSHKRMLSTIYERCGIKTWKQKSRAQEKIKRVLDHYKECDWIYSYKLGKEDLLIVLNKGEKSTAKRKKKTR